MSGDLGRRSRVAAGLGATAGPARPAALGLVGPHIPSRADLGALGARRARISVLRHALPVARRGDGGRQRARGTGPLQARAGPGRERRPTPSQRPLDPASHDHDDPEGSDARRPRAAADPHSERWPPARVRRRSCPSTFAVANAGSSWGPRVRTSLSPPRRADLRPGAQVGQGCRSAAIDPTWGSTPDRPSRGRAPASRRRRDEGDGSTPRRRTAGLRRGPCPEEMTRPLARRRRPRARRRGTSSIRPDTGDGRKRH